MKNILLLGAGKSSAFLIQYLLKEAAENSWLLRIGDRDLSHAKKIAGQNPCAVLFDFDLSNQAQLDNEVQNASLVISLLPAHLHLDVAKSCVKHQKNMVTASYISDAMLALDQEAKNAGIVILNEIGLDPGIDHLSAKKMIDELHHQGAKITSFLSFCGGLVHPDYCGDNPWRYKFTWNPRNVVLAAQSTAKFLSGGKIKYVPYQRIFKTATDLPFEGFPFGFEGYPNRDSLKYQNVYDLQSVETMMRGTIRAEGFMKAWQILIDLGITDDTYTCEQTKGMSYREWISAYLSDEENISLEEKIAKLANCSSNDGAMAAFVWTGLLSEEKITLENATPAQILQELLERKFLLLQEDKDLVLMQHQFVYELGGKKYQHFSSLSVVGNDQTFTAMAKTVGLPLAIAAKMILKKQITEKGVILPLNKAIYDPILEELAHFGIAFDEKTIEIN